MLAAPRVYLLDAATHILVEFVSKMKAIVVNEFHSDFNNLKVSEISQPQPLSDNILIRVVGSGVNFVDTLYAKGKHQNNTHLVRPPFTLGLEFSGIVLSSPATCQFQPGDAVFGGITGSYSEIISLPADSTSIRKVPSGWKVEDAAGLAATLPVSYGALAATNMKAGETVLIHSAAGGLGIMAVQIAVALGCRVIGTAGSAAKCDYVRKFGANECIDYTEDKWWEKILKLTDNKGVHVVFDPVGLVDRSLKCIAHRGRVVVVGFAGTEGRIEKIAMNRLLLKQVSVVGYRYGETLRRYPEECEQFWSDLAPLLASGAIKPTVCSYYRGLESVPQALHDISQRKIFGKAVVLIDADAKPKL
ncbi:hypothetical protein Golomagni_06838 [Golovinomyces magnicellulatus]|nr:hypothetical protein Golomagni_06838 [Golovinomyces magnicellulatus]